MAATITVVIVTLAIHAARLAGAVASVDAFTLAAGHELGDRKKGGYNLIGRVARLDLHGTKLFGWTDAAV